MPEGFARWRVALVPLGIALVLIGAVFAFTRGESSSSRSPTASSAAGSAQSAPSAPAVPASAAPAPAPAPSPMPSAVVAAGGADAASDAQGDSAPEIVHPPTRREIVAKQRDVENGLLTGYKERIVKMPAEISDLERQGRTADAARKRIELQRLQRLANETRNTIEELDGQLSAPPQ